METINICKEEFNKAFNQLKAKANALKKEVKALYLAYTHPDVPWYAKAIIILVVGYAFSPIDLIPDFVPVLGYLDDLLLIPLGVSVAIELIPADVMKECRQRSEDMFKSGKPKNWIAGAVIILIWLLVISLVGYKFLH